MMTKPLAGMLVLVVAAVATTAPGRAREPSSEVQQASSGPDQAAGLIARAYDAAFNLDHDRAIALARRAVGAEPEASRAHRTLAATLWMKVLFLRGAVTVDHFMSGMSDALKHLADPPADLDEELQATLARARALAEARLQREPDSVDARHEVGAVHALQASYVATIDGSLSAAFRSARRAFDAQEAVLERDPAHPLANATVGTYRYLVSTLGLPTRWLAYIAGFGGGADRGIAMLEQALETDGATVEAGTALMLIYSRESRHADAYRLALRLADAHPGNRLFVLEAASAAVRGGLTEEADRLLTAGLAALDRDRRPKVPGERAIWLYQRGLARLQQNRPAAAAADFRSALASGPYGWMRGRIRVGLGKVHDLAGRRDEARAAYAEARNICSALDDAVCEEEAKDLQRRPFSMDGGLE